jgi:heme-degrading monooxygenase HmoA
MKILWEYIVREDCLERFLELYSPTGRWVQLFKKHPGFVGTDLMRDTSNSTRFVTIDIWESLPAYTAMKEKSGAAYEVLDKLGDSLTISETCWGVFEG